MNLNSQTVKLAVVALVVAGATVFGVQTYMEKKQGEGRSALYQADQQYNEELKLIPEAERNTSLDVNAKFPKSVAAYQSAQTSGTDHTKFESAYRLAQIYLDHENYGPALEALNRAMNFASGSFEKSTILFLKGRILESTQKYPEANEAFDQALAKGFEGLKEELLAGLIRTYSKQNLKEKAKPLYEKLKAEFPKSKSVSELGELIR